MDNWRSYSTQSENQCMSRNNYWQNNWSLKNILQVNVINNFLRPEIIPVLVNIFTKANNPNLRDSNIWLEEDDAPPHYAPDVCQFSNHCCPGKCISRRGSIKWVTHTVFLCGYLKSKVYVDEPQNLQELQDWLALVIRITSSFSHIMKKTVI